MLRLRNPNPRHIDSERNVIEIPIITYKTSISLAQGWITIDFSKKFL